MKDTKDNILNVSLKMFAEKGYHASSIRKITSSLGLRESALYNHFSSKESILEELCFRYKPGRISSIILTDDLLDELNQPKKFLDLFAKRLLNHWFDKEENLFFKFVVKEGDIKYKDEIISLNIYINELRTIWWMIFDEMRKLNIIKNIDPKIITDEYLFYFIGLRIESITKSSKIDDLQKLITNHVNFIWNAIKKDERFNP